MMCGVDQSGGKHHKNQIRQWVHKVRLKIKTIYIWVV